MSIRIAPTWAAFTAATLAKAIRYRFVGHRKKHQHASQQC
jgi:hypothetical protein